MPLTVTPSLPSAVPTTVCSSASRPMPCRSSSVTDEQVAMEGLETMEQWMRELGLAMNITECGAKPELIEGMADACPICQGGYYILNRDEVVQVLKDSL